MLGWLITIRLVLDEPAVRLAFAAANTHPQRKAEFPPGALGPPVARWQSDPYGLKWIKDAAAEHGGVALARNGYPNWYLIRAMEAVQVVQSRQPHKPPMHEYPNWIVSEGDVILPGRFGKTTVDSEALKACATADWLVVEAWDES